MALGAHRSENFLKYLDSETNALQESGLYKAEYGITSPQQWKLPSKMGKNVSTCVPTTISAAPTITSWSRRRRTVQGDTGLAWLPCGLSVAHSRSTRSWRPA